MNLDQIDQNVETLKALLQQTLARLAVVENDLSILKGQFLSHNHTVAVTVTSTGSTTATLGDSSASITVNSSATATTSTPT